jgi:hypothetical protein
MRLVPLAAPLLCALVWTPFAARADCQSDGIQFFPAPGSVVPTNSRFILEGLGSEQGKVLALVGGQVTFRAPDDTVRATVVKGWRSEMNRAAVLLSPNHTFRPNKRYTLILDSLSSSTLLSEGADEPYWDSGVGPDEKAPRWLRKPAVSEGQYLYEGGRLTRFVKIATELEEQSPSYLVVTLQRTHGSTAQQTYFVPVHDAKATVGHDGCSGGFVFVDGESYRASVVGYDVAGNVAPNVPALEFRAPKPPRNR